MFPPRSSSFHNAREDFSNNSVNMDSKHSVSMCSIDMSEVEILRDQSLSSKSREYHEYLHCGSDTPAPFSDISRNEEAVTFPTEPSSFDAIAPRSSSPPLAFISDSRRLICSLDPVDTTLETLFGIARNMKHRQLASLNLGPQLDIKSSTGETYVRNVPQRMLFHFCVYSTVERRFHLSTDEGPDTLEISPSEAEKSGIVRVVRYMRRWCTSCGASPTGELRVPPSMRVGVETIRACRLFGLYADANRIEDLLVDTFIGGGNWNMTDEHVELIWDNYDGSLRDTAFGDAIVWFILKEVQSAAHPLADEIKWMMEQEEYGLLKERVKEENMRKSWRWEGRRGFLKRCQTEREKLEGRQRENRKVAKEVEKRVKATQKVRREINKRAPVVPVSSASRFSRPEALTPSYSSRSEQRLNQPVTKNLALTLHPKKNSIAVNGKSTRAEERSYPLRRVPSTETRLSDLWDEHDFFHADNESSTSKANKPLPKLPNKRDNNNINQGSNSTSSSREASNLPQPTSLRTHQSDVPYPYEHRAAR